jgi:hypothetical protein
MVYRAFLSRSLTPQRLWYLPNEEGGLVFPPLLPPICGRGRKGQVNDERLIEGFLSRGLSPQRLRYLPKEEEGQAFLPLFPPPHAGGGGKGR